MPTDIFLHLKCTHLLYTPCQAPHTANRVKMHNMDHGKCFPLMHVIHYSGEIFGIHFEPFKSKYHVHSSIKIFFDIFLTRKLFSMALMTHTVRLAHKLLSLRQFMSCSFAGTPTNLRDPSSSLLLLLSGLGVQEPLFAATAVSLSLLG